MCFQGSYSDLYPDSDDSSEDQIENSKNTWSCKVRRSSDTRTPAAEEPHRSLEISVVSLVLS